MSAPYDAAGAEIADVIDDMIDGVITPLAAGPLIAEQLQTVAPTQFLQYEKIIRVLGRVEGMLITDGPPTPDIGAIDSTCIDITNHRFYGPKTSEGWGEGVVFAGADVGSYIEELGFITPDQYGAVGNGVANDTVALQAALDTGLNVIRPPGKTYMHNATLTMNTSGQAFTGGGKLRTVGSIDSVLVTGGAVGVKLDLTFNSPGQTGGYTVKIDNAHRTQLNSLLVEDGYGTLWVEGANVVDIGFLWASCRGPGIKWFGDADSRSDILNIKFALIDPGAGHYGFDWDGNCHSLEAKYLGIVCGSTVGAGNSKGFIVRNTSGGPAPAIGRLTHVEVDYPTGPGIEIAVGSDFDLANSYVLGSNDSALKVGASINTGEVRVSGGKYRGATRYGIENLGGPILYSGNADLSSNGLGETSGNVWTVTPRLVLGNTASGHYLTTVGANPLWAWEGDSYMSFDVAGNSRNTTIGGTLIEALNATGLSITGVGTFTGYSSAGGGYYVPSGQAIQFDLGVSGNYNVYKTGTSLALTTGGDFLLQTSGGHSVSLRPDGANDVLAQYRGTTAQTFRVYNTRTDASNYARLSLGWSGTDGVIQTQAAGTGTLGSLLLNGASVGFQSGGTTRMYVAAAGHLLMQVDNTYDIGASLANRPRDLHLSRNITAGGSIIAGSSSSFAFSARAGFLSPADGVITLSNNAGTDFNRLQFGGITSAFPSLKRSGDGLHVRLADDTAYTSVRASLFWLTNGSYINDLADGVISLRNSTGSDFSRLTFGGSSSSFPSLKRSGANLALVRADDSGFTDLVARDLYSQSDTGALYLGVSADTRLVRDAANILAQRNGTTAQFFRVYNTYTDASNSERLGIGWNANTCFIATENAGTGSTRSLVIRAGNQLDLSGSSGSNGQWNLLSSGTFRPGTDNTFDLGQSGVRVRNLYVGTAVFSNAFSITSAAGTNRANIIAPSDGVIGLYNASNTDFSRLQFGGTTSAFPSLKRSTNEIHARLADDSGYANLHAQYLYARGGAVALGSSLDAQLWTDAADVLAQRRLGNAQAFRLYNTYTDASNFERFHMSWVANELQIGSAEAGTGVSRSLRMNGQTVSIATGNGTGSSRWQFSASGHLLAVADNTYDIGASGANRPRSIFVGTSITTGSHITMGSAAQLSAAGGATLSSPADGIWRMTNNAGTDFSRLQFGGTTNLFPALQRSLARILVRTADDSAYATLRAGVLATDPGILTFGGADDVWLIREGAALLAQRNGTNAQAFRVYNTYTDASNYERGGVGWTSNLLIFGFEKAGTGVDRSVRLAQGPSYVQVNPIASARQIQFVMGGTIIDYYNSSGHRLWETDNAFDLGAVGANRARTGYFGTSVVSPQFTIDGAFYLKLDAGNPQFVLDANDYFAYNRTTDVFLMVIGGASRLNITTTMVEATVPVKLPRYTVATLPAAASSTDMHALVTDALTPAWRATVVGGGAELTMVRSNGTNWIVVG